MSDDPDPVWCAACGRGPLAGEYGLTHHVAQMSDDAHDERPAALDAPPEVEAAPAASDVAPEPDEVLVVSGTTKKRHYHLPSADDPTTSRCGRVTAPGGPKPRTMFPGLDCCSQCAGTDGPSAPHARTEYCAECGEGPLSEHGLSQHMSRVHEPSLVDGDISLADLGMEPVEQDGGSA